MISSLFIVVIVAVCVFGYKQYGLTLFAMTPFVAGILCGYWTNRVAPLTASDTIIAATFSTVIAGVILFGVAMEGAVCLIMAFPLEWALAVAGAFLGRAVALREKSNPSHLSVLFMIAICPSTGFYESVTIPHDHIREVVTRVEIAAPVEQVWKYIASLPTLPQPTETLFRLGVAYPLYASASEAKVGGARTCVFSTGIVHETITQLEPNHLLSFDVAPDQPPLMKELSIYPEVDAPHLHGFVRSLKGEFRLTPTSNGNTLLEGRSFYRTEIAPVAYWGVISDYVVHMIHHRVLNHIRELSEASFKNS